jgi:hypothetical protein
VLVRKSASALPRYTNERSWTGVTMHIALMANRRLSRFIVQAWLAAFLSLAAACAAEAQTDSRPTKIVQFQVNIRFPPKAEHKPVPFDLVKGVLVFKVEINGREAWALLDNGSRDSLVDTDFARSLGLQLSSPVSPLGTTTGGYIERRRVPPVHIKIPGQADIETPLSAVSLASLSKFLDRPISLIFGQEYFANLMFLISPTKRTFQLARSGSLRAPADTPYIALKNDTSRLDILVNGEPASVGLDMGYNGDLSLSPAAWDRLGLDKLVTFNARSARLDARIVAEKGAIVERVRLGPIDVHRVQVRAQPTLAKDGDGTIGFGLLSRFDFAVDIKAQRIWLISRVGSNGQLLKAGSGQF